MQLKKRLLLKSADFKGQAGIVSVAVTLTAWIQGKVFEW